eukprot:UN23824
MVFGNLSKIPSSKKSAAKRPFPVELFTKKEIKVLAALNTPAKINDFLENLPYDAYDGYRSVRQTLRNWKSTLCGWSASRSRMPLVSRTRAHPCLPRSGKRRLTLHLCLPNQRLLGFPFEIQFHNVTES